MKTRSVALSVFVLALSSGCPRNGPDGPPQPPPMPLRDQTKCGVTKSQSEPLIVEWPSAERAELEALSRKGVVVVAYAGCEMRVLPRCRAPGGYEYTATTRKRDLVTITDADELYANVPVGAASLEGKLASSGQLNVAMTIVGRYESSRAFVGVHELHGECEGATHVVAGLTSGSFRFFAGASAEAGGGVGAFGAGAGAKTKATSELLARDGDEASCAKSTSVDAAPPDGCGGILRIEVVPIGRAKVVAPTCPPGTAWDGKKCHAAGAPKALVTCRGDDAADCTKRCHDGDVTSCVFLGQLYVSGAGGLATDGAKARALFERTCEAGSSWACSNLGQLLWFGQAGVTVDKTRAVAALERGCAGQDATACMQLGNARTEGAGGLAKDEAKATALYRRGCELGSVEACGNLGLAYEYGRGVAIDKAKAATLYQRACDAGLATACGWIGGFVEKGEGGLTADPAKALRLYERACGGGDDDGCKAAKRLKGAGS